MADELVVIFGTEIEIEAILCKEMLQSHGIGVIERRNRHEGAGVAAFITGFTGVPSFELLIRQGDADYAARLVEQFMAEEIRDEANDGEDANE